jgi:hypothetical protein
MERLGQLRRDGVCRERCAGNVWQPKKKGGRDWKWIGDTGERKDGSDYQDLDIDFSQPFCGEGEKRVEEMEGG